MDCGKITAGLVGAFCETLANGGTSAKIWMFNFEDIDKANSTYTETNVTTIAMKQGKKGYIVTSFDNATEGNATLNVGTYINTYDHQVTLRVFDDSDDAREFMASAKNARVIICLQKKTHDGSFINEIYGWDSGLKLSENPYNTKYTDNVVYAPVFKTDADSKERNMPQLVSMGEAAIDALCQAPVI